RAERGGSMMRRLPSGTAIPLIVMVLSCASAPKDQNGALEDPDFAWRQNWQESPQWGGRLGYLDNQGTLRVRMRFDPERPWLIVAKDVKDFQLMDWRLGVLKNDGTLLMIENGALNQPLRTVDVGVEAVQMTATKVGILRANGEFRVKEAGLRGPVTFATGVKAFQVTSDYRTGILGSDNSFWLAQGAMTSAVRGAFQKIADDVESFQLEREWVAYTQRGRLFVAKAELYSPLTF